jgi:hypothetical protein
MYHWLTKSSKKISDESGMTLVITLFLLLSLLMMASGITFIANNFASLSDGVTNKAFAIDGAETCVDKSFEWLSTDNGKSWLTTGSTDKDIALIGEDLFQYTVFTDTTNASDLRVNALKNYAGKTLCKSVLLTKLEATNNSSGSEIGTSQTYDTSVSAYIIRVRATGLFNVPLTIDNSIDSSNWRGNSSIADIEIISSYTP